MADKIRPLKIESTPEGEDNDEFPTAANPNEDMVETHGIVLQDTTSADETVSITRNEEGNIVFKDQSNSPVTLTTLTSGGFDPSKIILDNAGTIVYVGDGDILLKK